MRASIEKGLKAAKKNVTKNLRIYPLASIGTEKGKPFRPDARMKKILTDRVAIANAAARSIVWYPRVDGIMKGIDFASASKSGPTARPVSANPSSFGRRPIYRLGVAADLELFGSWVPEWVATLVLERVEKWVLGSGGPMARLRDASVEDLAHCAGPGRLDRHGTRSQWARVP